MTENVIISIFVCTKMLDFTEISSGWCLFSLTRSSQTQELGALQLEAGFIELIFAEISALLHRKPKWGWTLLCFTYLLIIYPGDIILNTCVCSKLPAIRVLCNQPVRGITRLSSKSNRFPPNVWPLK